MPSRFEPYGARSRDTGWGADCSCDGRWYLPLAGDLATDWDVCSNPASPRAGPLTWEYQGCPEFRADGVAG